MLILESLSLCFLLRYSHFAVSKFTDLNVSTLRHDFWINIVKEHFKFLILLLTDLEIFLKIFSRGFAPRTPLHNYITDQGSYPILIHIQKQIPKLISYSKGRIHSTFKKSYDPTRIPMSSYQSQKIFKLWVRLSLSHNNPP